jgi:hypothetical protein
MIDYNSNNCKCPQSIDFWTVSAVALGCVDCCLAAQIRNGHDTTAGGAWTELKNYFLMSVA